jgi:hypothetical protein
MISRFNRKQGEIALNSLVVEYMIELVAYCEAIQRHKLIDEMLDPTIVYYDN